MKNDDEILRQYITDEASFHAEKLGELGDGYNSRYSSTYNKWCKRTRNNWTKLTDLGIEMPTEFMRTYPIPFKEFVDSEIFMKYQVRGYNC